MSLTQDIAYAERLSAANSTDAVATVLEEILLVRVPGLDVTIQKRIVDGLTAPVLMACTKSNDRGRRDGEFVQRQTIANQLGLGKLQE